MPNLTEGSEAASPRGRILIVEDEAGIRFVAREVLEAEGYRVSEAVDGEDGLAKFLETLGTVDLVILDLVMPRMHGFQVMDSIRQVAPRTPILLSSGYSPQDRPEVLVPTAHLGFLAKPYRSRELLDQVARLLAANPGNQL